MIAYIDSSVLIRVLLSEANVLPEWPDIHIALTSSLLRVESFVFATHDRELATAARAVGFDVIGILP